MKTLIGLVLSLTAFASGSASPQRDVVDVGWVYEYSTYLESILTPEIKRASIASLCPGARDREAVTLAIFKAMAKAESGYDRKQRYGEPIYCDKVTKLVCQNQDSEKATAYAEELGVKAVVCAETTRELCRDAVTGRAPIWSEGLYQVSYQDAKFYACQFDWSRDRQLASTSGAKTIFDPYRNMNCAVKIITKQINNGGTFQQAGKRYWSVLNPAKPGYRRFRAALIEQRGECR